MQGRIKHGADGLQPQAQSSDRPTRISKEITKFYLKFFAYCMFIRKIILSFAEQNN